MERKREIISNPSVVGSGVVVISWGKVASDVHTMVLVLL